MPGVAGSTPGSRYRLRVDEPTSNPARPGAPPGRPAEVRHVPEGGISVYEHPDGSVPAIAELAGGDELRIVGRRPPWVHVQTDGGLDGWVDGTALAGVAVGAAPPEPVLTPGTAIPIRR